MKETTTNKKIYYHVAWFIIAIMVLGLIIDNPRLDDHDIVFIAHSIQVLILSVCLLLYPRYDTAILRWIIITAASFLCYTLFLFYPETSTTFIFLCLIPALAILYFDTKLFYFTLLVNYLSVVIIFATILLIDGLQYPFVEEDMIGNIFNFTASQIIVYFIFSITNGRMKKQQVYYEQVQHSERLKTTGQLAAAVAHEIRNPLTVVKGFLQFFEQDSSFSEERKEHIALMIDELNTAEEVISQFLTVAKPDKENVTEHVNVGAVLRSVTDLLHSYGLLHDNRIELEVTGDCTIAANNMELKQLLINLIKNAIEASNIGEKVQVIAGRERDFVVINVIDYGRGMTEMEVASLGTPFYSLKSKGTGLGMMICFNIIEKFKGTIDFESSIGQGTTITIRFPAC
ncbi:MAG: sensor histidine kinase [Neobacillus sp.]|jgi:two-component system sporulation sensor kinase B|nr:sensor histidine kinase [Neobacillus sp.]